MLYENNHLCENHFDNLIRDTSRQWNEVGREPIVEQENWRDSHLIHNLVRIDGIRQWSRIKLLKTIIIDFNLARGC
jgi:hypothetical protein